MALTARVREEVLWSGDCAYCPLSRGGTDDRANLAPACRPCNMEKLDFTPDEYRAYREEKGLGWPPKSQWEFLGEILAKLREEYGDECVDRAIARFRSGP